MTKLNQKKKSLGIVGVIISLVVLAANPLLPQNFRSNPQDLRSPVIVEVWMALKDWDGNYVDHSGDAFRAEMGIEWRNQIGANDCAYWTGWHYDGPLGFYWGTEHTFVGDNDYPDFMWFNQGSGYDDFKARVERLPNSRSGFATRGREDVTITFTGGDYEATVTPSDGTASYTVPVYYNCQIELGVTH